MSIIIFISGLDKNIEAEHLTNAFKIIMMVGDIRLREEVEGIAGDVYVLDASTVTPSHLTKISPACLKKFFICIQVCF